MAPMCTICSYKQPRPERPKEVNHHHYSSKDVRIAMGVERFEDSRDNPDHLCPTCQKVHHSNPEEGLNICVSSLLHNFHFPPDTNVTVPPDNLHVDWVTIPGASIDDLCYAWRLDYHKEPRPMRIMLIAGIDDLIKGGNEDTVKEAIEGFKANVDSQNKYHLNGSKNEFCVAPILNPPKLCWFPDNGPESTPL